MDTDKEEGVTCPGCKRSYRWRPELAGKRVKCKCQQVLVFPVEMPGKGEGEGVENTQESLAAMAQPQAAVGGNYDLDAGPKVETAPVAAAPQRVCPTCSTPVSAEAVLCTRCGTNLRTGKKLGTTVKGSGPEMKDVAATAGKVVLSLVLGGVTAVVCAVLWIVVAYFTEREFGILAWGVGLAIGGVIRLVNRNGGTVAGLAAIGFVLFFFLMIKGVSVLGAMAMGEPMINAFSPFDLLWGFLAIGSAYKLGAGTE